MKNILKTGLLSGRLRGVADVNGVGGGNTYEFGGQYRNLAYAYNTRGFIQSRADSTAMQCETYTYDNLDRLSSYTVNGGVVSDVFYNLFIKSNQDGGWDWSRTQNGWKIDIGLLETDPNKSGWGRFWEVASRFTWQLPQTTMGYLLCSTANSLGMVNNVTYGYGMTVVDSDLNYGAATLGNYSIGSTGYTADWRNHLFVHEYGHYIQSQQHGPLYLVTVGVPSVQSAILSNVSHGKINHHERWFEADASYKGSDYFDKYFGSGKEGYIADSPFYFDKNSFANKYHSPYINHMTNDNTQNIYHIYCKFHWTDITIYITIIGLFPCFLYL